MSKRMNQPELTRIVVAEDGRVKANFDDASILLLNSTGSAFICCSGETALAAPTLGSDASSWSTPGSSLIRSRQLSEFALSRHSPQLAVVLEFRNMHMDLPFFCKPLLRAPR